MTLTTALTTFETACQEQGGNLSRETVSAFVAACRQIETSDNLRVVDLGLPTIEAHARVILAKHLSKEDADKICSDLGSY